MLNFPEGIEIGKAGLDNDDVWLAWHPWLAWQS